MKIGVFDSGVGGLTVLKTLIKKYSNNEYIYFGDNLNAPYGEKTVDELKLLSSNIVEFLISKKVDVIVIACGTVSSNVYNYLNDKYNIKIIDIISPTIKYINKLDYKNITVLATQATVNSKIFSKKIKDKNVIEIPCPSFVPIIENGNYDNIDIFIKNYLKNIQSDLIVLGCTHYPLIKESIESITNTETLDMSECLPKVFKNNGNYKLDMYFTKIDSSLLKNISKFNFKINEIKKYN